MDGVRAITSTALSLRKQSGRRVRLPLTTLTVVTAGTTALAEFSSILQEELNVKQIELIELADDSAEAWGISNRLTVNARAAGPRLGKGVQQVIQAAKAGDWSETDGVVTAGGVALEPGEYELTLETDGVAEGTALALLSGGGFVLLDTVTTPELEAEGLSRDFVRVIQDARKAAGFDVSDRIRLTLYAAEESDWAAAEAHAAVIARETLALEHRFVQADDPETAAAVAAVAGVHRTLVPAGSYANAGLVVIDVITSGVVSV
jgi:isoleucyl-tRNA synthetase